jgi:hypothetical protein
MLLRSACMHASMHARAGGRQEEYGYVPWIPLDRPDHDDLQQRLFDRLTVGTPMQHTAVHTLLLQTFEEEERKKRSLASTIQCARIFPLCLRVRLDQCSEASGVLEYRVHYTGGFACIYGLQLFAMQTISAIYKIPVCKLGPILHLSDPTHYGRSSRSVGMCRRILVQSNKQTK